VRAGAFNVLWQSDQDSVDQYRLVVYQGDGRTPAIEELDVATGTWQDVDCGSDADCRICAAVAADAVLARVNAMNPASDARPVTSHPMDAPPVPVVCAHGSLARSCSICFAIEEAFREGYREGFFEGGGWSPSMTVEEAWAQSDAKRSLEAKA